MLRILNLAVSLMALCCLFESPAANAGRRTTCQSDLQTAPPLQLNIWRYYGQTDFNSAHHLHLSYDPDLNAYRLNHIGLASGRDRYSPLGPASLINFEYKYRWFINPVRAEFSSDAEGDTAYERIQYYSLKLMERIKYLDANGINQQLQTSLQRKTNQVTLFEVTESQRLSEVKKEYGKIPDFARPDSEANAWSDYQNLFDHDLIADQRPARGRRKAKADPVYEVKIGVSWLISGQDADGPIVLPLESETLERPIARDQFAHIWEIGRAAQTKDSGFEETLKAAAHMAYYELLALNGDINKAYVFAHSLAPLHTRLYRSKFGMSDYSSYRGNPTEKCLYAPLAELLRRYPIESFSSTVQDVIRASKGRMDGMQALSWIQRVRSERNTILSGPGGLATETRDFSNITYPWLRAQLKNTNEEVLEVLWTQGPAYRSRDSFGEQALAQGLYNVPVMGIYQEPQMTGGHYLQRLREFLSANNAVEVLIRNNDAERLLVETYRHHFQKLKSSGVAEPLEWMTQNQIHFCATAIGRSFGNTGVRSGKRWFVRRDEWVHMGSFLSIGFNQVVVPRMEAESLCFTAEEVAAWAATRPTSDGPFQPGREQTDVLLSDPQLFAP